MESAIWDTIFESSSINKIEKHNYFQSSCGKRWSPDWELIDTEYQTQRSELRWRCAIEQADWAKHLQMQQPRGHVAIYLTAISSIFPSFRVPQGYNSVLIIDVRNQSTKKFFDRIHYFFTLQNRIYNEVNFWKDAHNINYFMECNSLV